MYLINVQTKDDPRDQSNCKAENMIQLIGIISKVVRVHGKDLIKITIKTTL